MSVINELTPKIHMDGYDDSEIIHLVWGSRYFQSLKSIEGILRYYDKHLDLGEEGHKVLEDLRRQINSELEIAFNYE